MRDINGGDIRYDEGRQAYVLGAQPDLEFTRCTDFVESFFAPFNAREAAERASRGQKHRGQSPAAIMRQWDEKRRLGERGHAQIADFVRHGHQPSLPVARRGANWLQDRYPASEHAHTAEVVIYDEARRLAGTVDLLCKKPGGTWLLLDWKTAEKIEREGFNGQKGVRGPARSWDDCRFTKYALQISLYRLLLEENYNIEVDEQAIVQLTDSGVSMIPCLYRKSQVQAMLAYSGR